MPKKKATDTKAKVEQLVKDGVEGVSARFEELFYDNARHCESPIEELLLAALYLDHDIHEFDVVFMGDLCPSDGFVRGETIYIYQQARVGEYRTDFLIHDCSCPLDVKDPRWMVVECDGHNFHEKTKEQARRDKKRDRYFQSIGYKVLRFTGSEIYADAEACANEILLELSRDDEWRNRDR